jgi:hypothetical protein
MIFGCATDDLKAVPFKTRLNQSFLSSYAPTFISLRISSTVAIALVISLSLL